MEFKIFVLKSTKIPCFSLHIFSNVDSSFNIKDRLIKYSLAVLGIMMEGTMSQICYSGPSFYFM